MKSQLLASVLALFLAACSAGGGSEGASQGSGASTGSGASGGTVTVGSGGASGGGVNVGGLNAGGASGNLDNPATCDEAASAHSYVGCEFWPTVTANPVYLEFDPAVVIANGGDADATVTIDGPDGFHKVVTVTAGGLQTVLLEWVLGLKGPEFSLTNTSGGRLTESARVDGGAYHLTSSVPVTVWQFNPLQYVKAASACPRIQFPEGATECLSATVDASLLLPTAAMTGNYRIFAYSSKHEGPEWGTVPGGAAITATADGTEVKVQLGPKCGVEIYPTTDLGTCVAAGPGVEAKNSGDVYTFQMNAGDVVQLVGAWAEYPQIKNADISGSVVNASAPVQVVAFNAISQLPDSSVANADHMEESVLPAEVIGKKYIVVPPTTPNGNAVGHVVRIYGNVDGTNLTYPEGKPAGAPDVINAGDVVQIPPLPTGQPAPDCFKATADHCMLNTPFIVESDQPFAVASFMVGGTLQMPGTDAYTSQGDPAFTMEVTPEQFRKEYTFLAPSDYLENFADVLIPKGAEVTLDGSPLAVTPEAIGASDWTYARAPLSGTNGGVHKISTTDERGLGLQVAGFGRATSYYYPGGLNLHLISDAPVIIIK